jgi:predicted XRE-type DNA-binding protein
VIYSASAGARRARHASTHSPRASTGNDLITASSGNVFEDLGLPDADDRLARAELARQIGAIICERGLTQQAAASILGVDQPKVSALMTGQLSGFSLERLARFLTLLGRDLQLPVKSEPGAFSSQCCSRGHRVDDEVRSQSS